jgi:hypothetical protein
MEQEFMPIPKPTLEQRIAARKKELQDAIVDAQLLSDEMKHQLIPRIDRFIRDLEKVLEEAERQ